MFLLTTKKEKRIESNGSNTRGRSPSIKRTANSRISSRSIFQANEQRGWLDRLSFPMTMQRPSSARTRPVRNNKFSLSQLSSYQIFRFRHEERNMFFFSPIIKFLPTISAVAETFSARRRRCLTIHVYCLPFLFFLFSHIYISLSRESLSSSSRSELAKEVGVRHACFRVCRARACAYPCIAR